MSVFGHPCTFIISIVSNTYSIMPSDHNTSQWRHTERDGVSNHRPGDCLFNCLFRRRSKETSQPRVTDRLCGNSPVTCELPAQRASNTENVSIWWRHHEKCYPVLLSVSHYCRFANSFRPVDAFMPQWIRLSLVYCFIDTKERPESVLTHCQLYTLEDYWSLNQDNRVSLKIITLKMSYAR